MFNAITVADKIKGVAGSALIILTAVGTVDFGSDTVNGIVAGAAALLLALGVKPLGPATE